MFSDQKKNFFLGKEARTKYDTDRGNTANASPAASSIRLFKRIKVKISLIGFGTSFLACMQTSSLFIILMVVYCTCGDATGMEEAPVLHFRKATAEDKLSIVELHSKAVEELGGLRYPSDVVAAWA